MKNHDLVRPFGYCVTYVRFEGRSYVTAFAVLPRYVGDVILGRDFLAVTGAFIDIVQIVSCI